jgi:ABC-type polysaccharide/polyol phosphate export permease
MQQGRNEDPRILAMFHGDRNWSLVAVITLWALYGFVFYEVMNMTGSFEATMVLGIFGILVLLFNTASILAMVFHLKEERAEIYGLDLHYLDIAKK